MLTVDAPAKLNLTLEVLGKRPDGYHEIRSVMQTISLCDRFSFQSGRDIDIKCNMPGWRPEKSLVSRAVRLVQEATGYAGGVTIEVEKRIPLLSGLGGDSSDAAATLRGLDQLWALDLPVEKMRQLALKLGSDVPFFLTGGTALVSGRGENVAQLPPLAPTWFVVLMPSVPRQEGKTARLYGSLSASQFTDGSITVNLVSSTAIARQVSLPRLFNVFDSVAFDSYPELEDYWVQFAEAGAQEIHLAGSGPALFKVARDKLEAETLYNKLKSAGLDCYLVQSLNGS